jgi:deazaflavin-dependent oxidoreductase (nitroreductase family)
MSGTDEYTAQPASDYAPSPSARVRDQVALYEAAGGTDGGALDGRPVVILTSTGAKSGKIRKNPVMRVEDGGVYVAIASAAGSPRDPDWYHNLLAHPDVQLQDGAELHRVRAREVFGTEKDRWWAIADAVNPNYGRYRATAGREIPVLALEPVNREDDVD